MPDPHPPLSEQDPDDIETKLVARTAVPGHPHPARATQLALLPPVYGSQRPPETGRLSGLYLDKRHHSPARSVGLGRNEVDIPMPAPKSAVQNFPAMLNQPHFRHSLASLAQFLTFLCHVDRG